MTIKDDATAISDPSSLSSDVLAQIPTFVPTGRLQNLIKIQTLDNPSPTTGVLVGDRSWW